MLVEKPPALSSTLHTIQAFRKLFEIENILRILIVQFDPDYRKRVYNPTLGTLISIAEKAVSRKVLNVETLSQLYWMIDIRNKICHMSNITEREYNVINDCWQALVNDFKTCQRFSNNQYQYTQNNH
jgi:hypothetical protein